MKVMGPQYGAAPVELAKKHRALVKELETLYAIGERLSPQAAQLQKEVDELEDRIRAYNQNAR